MPFWRHWRAFARFAKGPACWPLIRKNTWINSWWITHWKNVRLVKKSIWYATMCRRPLQTEIQGNNRFNVLWNNPIRWHDVDTLFKGDTVMVLKRSRKAIHLFTLLTFLYGTAGIHLTHPHHLFGFSLSHGPPTVKSIETTINPETHKQCSICTLLASLQFSSEPPAEIVHFEFSSPVLANRLSNDISCNSDGSPNPRAPPFDAL